MDILYLVDRLEELINEGRRVPLTSNVVVDADEVLDIIDQMRMTIPEEIKQAKRIQTERDRLVSQAQEERDRILALAREESQGMLDDHEVLKAAEAQRQAVLEEGRREARRLVSEANEYAFDVLGQLENQLAGFLSQVRNGVSTLQQRTRPQTGMPQPEDISAGGPVQ